jgi:hypothetical protein
MAETATFWRTTARVAVTLLPWVFFQRLSDGIRWAHANMLSGDQRYEEALRVARNLPPRIQQWSDWKLFEIQQLCLLDWHQETIEKANAFLLPRLLQANPSEDSRYFNLYAQWCGRRAFLLTSEDSPLPSIFDCDLADIDLSKVSDRWKRRFPLNDTFVKDLSVRHVLRSPRWLRSRQAIPDQ